MQDQFTDDLTTAIRNSKAILVCVGAGISVNAGIPDFRSPDNGVYARIGHAEEVFHIENYQCDPIPFYTLCTDMFDLDFRKIEPTSTHYFIKRLSERGKLLRCYSQNIDGLEKKAGLREVDELIQCHGNLDSIECSECQARSGVNADNWSMHVKEFVQLNIKDPSRIPSNLKCEKCGGFLKPSVVMFGEQLPPDFFRRIQNDIRRCDLVLIIGTSLTVFPFASIPQLVHPNVPQYVISRGVKSGHKYIDADCDEILSKVFDSV